MLKKLPEKIMTSDESIFSDSEEDYSLSDLDHVNPLTESVTMPSQSKAIQGISPPQTPEKKKKSASSKKKNSTSPKKKSTNSEEKNNTVKGSEALFIIDPQNDFYPAKSGLRAQGALAVPGANEDMAALLTYLKDHEPDEIFVSLDTHQHYDIGQPSFWVDDRGRHPSPFTTITLGDLQSEKWKPLKSNLTSYVLKYAKKLKKNGKHCITVWPYHAIEDTNGHNVVTELQEYLRNWEETTGKKVSYVPKGENQYTEFYSAFRAEIPLKKDSSTELNHEFINKLKRFDRVVVTGEALSHCVNYTLRDLIEHWPKTRIKDVVFLEDASSSVPGFEDHGKKLLAFAHKSGITLKKIKH